IVSFIAFILIGVQAQAQRLATLEVSLTKETAGSAIPLSVNLDEITLLPEAEIGLVEVKNNKRTPVPFQIENRGQRILYWIVQQDSRSAGKRVFELVKGAPGKAADSVKVAKVNDALVISANHKNLLQYNYKTHYPPAGVD